MEARFGPPGTGRRELRIAGQPYTVAEVMARLGLAVEGCRTIDGLELSPTHFVVRYYDAEEQRVVAYEFDAQFRYLGETRVHVAEWVAEDALGAASAWPEQESLPPWTSS